MCRKLELGSVILGLIFSLSRVSSAFAAACPDTATDVGSGQSISTSAKGSGINVQSGVLPAGVAPCQVIVVSSTVKYAGITTYAWSGVTATITPITGLTIFGTQETVQNVAPANFTTVVLSDPANATCPGVLTESLLSFDYTPSAADIAAGGVTFLLQYTGTAQSGANDQVTGSATITVKIHSCDDLDPCTTDACVPNLAGLATCTHTPVNCDDGDACTTDLCVAGVCTHTPINCDDRDACTTDLCVAGVCTHTPVNCNDNDACTTDLCVAGVCTHTPVNCNDNDACTTDLCVAGVCTHTPVNCDDGDACTTDLCVAGVCSHTPVNCDDGDACTDDTCVPGTGCVHTPNNTCGRGCTPGFFKNCTASWPSCATPTTTLVDAGFVVGGCGCTAQAGVTFIQALGLKGGNTTCGGIEILLRAAAAAYLNACLGGYPVASPADVVAEVNAALASCDRATILAEATRLDGFNNLGCKNADGTDRKCLR